MKVMLLTIKFGFWSQESGISMNIMDHWWLIGYGGYFYRWGVTSSSWIQLSKIIQDTRCGETTKGATTEDSLFDGIDCIYWLDMK